MKKRKVNINRAGWVNGRHGHASALLNSYGEKCCLGFAIHQITRCPLRKLQDETYDTGKLDPTDFFTRRSFLTDLDGSGEVCNNAFADRAIEINDDCNLSDTEREAQLITLFKENDITLTFTGEYVE